MLESAYISIRICVYPATMSDVLKTMRMSRWRFWCAHTAISLVVMGSLLCIATDREFWPFSQYPMFSEVTTAAGGGALKELRLIGITAEATPREFSLSDLGCTYPFRRSRLKTAIKWISKRPHSQQLLNEAARNMLVLYEENCRSGRCDGPPLRGIRLMWLEWDHIDPTSPGFGAPDRQVILAEVAKPLADVQ